MVLGSRGRTAILALAMACVCLVLAPSAPASAAGSNELLDPQVTPRTGTETTRIYFSVRYRGNHPVDRVVVLVAGQRVRLHLVSGTLYDGRFQANRRLPAGSWTVVFTAVAQKGNDPRPVDGGSVTVAPAPTPKPTPKPNPKPTPAPVTQQPTPAPATLAPAATAPATPRPVAAGRAKTPSAAKKAAPKAARSAPTSRTPKRSAAAQQSAAPSSDSDVLGALSLDGRDPGSPGGEAVFPIMIGGLGVVALVAMYGIFLAGAARRREREPQPALESPAPNPEPELRPRALASWEVDARLEDAPLGTVDYLPLENGAAIGSPPPDFEDEPDRPRRTNPRLARLEAARSHRASDDRRSLLRRSLYPDDELSA